MHRVIDGAGHPARGAHLDHLRILAELQPHGPQALRHAVAQLQEPAVLARAGDPASGQAVHVGVATGLAKHRTRGVDARAVDRAFLDSRNQPDAHTAGFAQAGEPGLKRSLSILGCARCRGRDGRDQHVLQAEPADTVQMRMTVPHAGHHHRHVHIGARGRARAKARRGAGVADSRAACQDRRGSQGSASAGDEHVGVDPAHATALSHRQHVLPSRQRTVSADPAGRNEPGHPECGERAVRAGPQQRSRLA